MEMSMMGLWKNMGYFAKGIVFTLAIMSIYSLTIMFQKWWRIRKAQMETRKFAPEFSQFLEEDNLTEAIKLAEGYKKSHVAKVLGSAFTPPPPMDIAIDLPPLEQCRRNYCEIGPPVCAAVLNSRVKRERPNSPETPLMR